MRLADLAARLDARLDGDGDRRILRVAPLDTAGSDALAGLFERRFREAAGRTEAAAVVVDEALAEALPPGCARLVHPEPRAAWGNALRLLHPRPPLTPPPPGIDPRAVVHPTAQVAPDARVGPFAVVDAEARVGPGAAIFAFVHVGPGAVVGPDAVLATRASVLDGCAIGAGSWIGPGAVIGSVGFGIDRAGRLPHVGRVRVGAGVTIGAQSCVDRATVGETVIGDGAHLDNLVQVGHNAHIGPRAVLCGQVGIAGGARIGAGVVIGGQAGVAGHVTVGPGVRLAAQSGVTKSLRAPGDYSGHPAEPNRARLRRLARERRGEHE